jgi:hypothetical protein
VSGLEVLAEGILDPGEAGLDVSSDAHVHDVVLSSSRQVQGGRVATRVFQGRARLA